MSNPSKAKGRAFEHEVAAAVGGVRRENSGSDGKGDIVVETGLFAMYTVEAKVRKVLAVDTWFAQADRAAERATSIPLLVVKRDRGRLLAVVDFDHLKDLLEEYHYLNERVYGNA